MGSQTDGAFADLTVGAPTTSGTTSTFTNVPATLTPAGSSAFAGFYAAGTALDACPATFSVTVDDATPPPPPPADPLTALVNQLVAALQAVLASLGG